MQSHKQKRAEKERQRQQQSQGKNAEQILNPGCTMMVNNIGEEKLLLSHLQPHMRVLEFGFGLSTKAIASRVQQVVSIEHDAAWYERFKDDMPPNVIHVLVPASQELASGSDGSIREFQNYINQPLAYSMHDKFDLVFIDGRARVDCARATAASYLKEGGLIFIHDYRHPDPRFFRQEYLPVEQFLDMKKHVFAMACFTRKGEDSPYLNVVQKVVKNIADIPEENGMADIPVQGVIMARPHVEHTIISKPYIEDTRLQTNIAEIPANDGIIEVIPASVPEKLPLYQVQYDQSTCWHTGQTVIDEMNRFFDNHIKDHEIAKHMEPLTKLLNLIDAENDHRLLDLGCGTGMMIPFCDEFEYCGADLPHIIAGCAMRNYPNQAYRTCDIVADDLLWIKPFDVIVLNGIIDVMEFPLEVLDKILKLAKKYVLIHRQDITDEGETKVHKNGSYGGQTYHTVINRQTFQNLVAGNNFRGDIETNCGFGKSANGDWENGGSSFLLVKNQTP